MSDTDFQHRLADLADGAGYRPIDLERVARRVRRRRSAKGVLAGAAAGLVLTAGVVGVQAAAGHETQRPSAPAAAPPTGASVFRCGDEVSAGATYGPVTMAVTRLRRTSDGPPRVTYTLTSTQSLTAARYPGLPRILLLRDGKVIAGQDDATLRVPDDKVLRETTYGPGRPYTAELPAMQSRPCDNLTWSQIWSEPGRYQVAVVARCLQLGIGAPTGAPTADGPVIAAVAALNHV